MGQKVQLTPGSASGGKRTSVRVFIALAFILALSACIRSTVTPTVATATQNAPATALPPTQPAATFTPLTQATNTSESIQPTLASTDTAQPTAMETPAVSADVPVITAQNVANLRPAPLALPSWAGQFIWPPKTVQIPGLPGGTTPDLLAKDGDTLYPVQFNPPAVGPAFTLNVPGPITAIAPDLSSLVYLDSTSGRFILASLNGKILAILDEIAPYGASYSPDGKLLAITSQNEHAVTLYAVPSGPRVTRLTGFESAAPVYAAGILPGNQNIYWIARANLKLQDIASGSMGKEFSYADFIGQVLFTPDGQHMIISVADKLYLYTVPAGDRVGEITLSQPLRSLSLSPDGKLLAGGYGEALQIWDAASLAPVANLPGAISGPVEFSADGRYIASLQEGNVINIWSVRP